MASFLAVSVGNTNTSIARVEGGTIVETSCAPSRDASAVAAAATALAGGEIRLAVVATVAPRASDAIVAAVRAAGIDDIASIPDDMGIPIATRLAPEATPGQDRLLCATAAWRRMEQAVIIVDAGTCVTVDFVDGEGTFHGGAIAPGRHAQLRAMHEATEALPEIDLASDSTEPFGSDTASAMRLGVTEGVRGLVHRLIERYAEAYGAFPIVIATGGDAEHLFRDDELVNIIAPDLVLEGISCAYAAATGDEDDRPKFGEVRRPGPASA